MGFQVVKGDMCDQLDLTEPRSSTSDNADVSMCIHSLYFVGSSTSDAANMPERMHPF